MSWYHGKTLRRLITMENQNTNQLIIADENINVYTSPSENSEVLVSYSKGSFILVNGVEENGWQEVSYQGKTGYMKTDNATEEYAIDNEALTEEFELVEEEGELISETIEVVQTNQRQTIIWISVIVVLLIGIVVISIFESKKKRALDALCDGSENDAPEGEDYVCEDSVCEAFEADEHDSISLSESEQENN